MLSTRSISQRAVSHARPIPQKMTPQRAKKTSKNRSGSRLSGARLPACFDPEWPSLKAAWPNGGAFRSSEQSVRRRESRLWAQRGTLGLTPAPNACAGKGGSVPNVRAGLALTSSVRAMLWASVIWLLLRLVRSCTTRAGYNDRATDRTDNSRKREAGSEVARPFVSAFKRCWGDAR
jgi:hypothetical protein